MRLSIVTLKIGCIIGGATVALAANFPTAGGQQTFEVVVPVGVQTYHDMAYVPNGHVRQKLDLYLPPTGTNHPVIVYIHGGGFTKGSKNSPWTPVEYVKKGFAVAALDYRFSSDVLFPAQIEDCKAAVRWLRANAKLYRLNPNRFVSFGESAGGHLAALLGTTAHTKKFDVGENLNLSSAVQASVVYFGPTDFLQMDAHRLPDGKPSNGPESSASLLIGGPIQENKGKAENANPIAYVSAQAPPFFIAHGTHDQLVPFNQSELLVAALKKVGVPVQLLPVGGANHEFLGATKAQMDEVNQKTAVFILKVMKVK